MPGAQVSADVKISGRIIAYGDSWLAELLANDKPLITLGPFSKNVALAVAYELGQRAEAASSIVPIGEAAE